MKGTSNLLRLGSFRLSLFLGSPKPPISPLATPDSVRSLGQPGLTLACGHLCGLLLGHTRELGVSGLYGLHQSELGLGSCWHHFFQINTEAIIPSKA